jgi:hypothetical protein
MVARRLSRGSFEGDRLLPLTWRVFEIIGELIPGRHLLRNDQECFADPVARISQRNFALVEELGLLDPPFGQK